jgi:hypothetical protein
MLLMRIDARSGVFSHLATTLLDQLLQLQGKAWI